MTNLVDDLRGRIAGEVRFDQISRALYATDASMYEIEPIGVVIPKSADDLQAVVELANQYGVPVLVRGAGTSLSGQSVGEAILLDCSKYLNRILEVNADERWVRVQPGVVLDHLNKHLEPYGFWFGPDVSPSSRATVGGMMGNNSAGMRSIIYGKTIDHVITQDVILADGTRARFEELDESAFAAKTRLDTLEGQIYREVERLVNANRAEVEARYPKVMRRVGGYNLDAWGRNGTRNLAHLAVGSEGTLVAVTEAKLRIVPRSKLTALTVVHFDDIFSALDSMVSIIESNPTSVELIDRLVLDMTRQSPEFSRRLTFVEGEPGALLVVEYFGATEDELRAQQDNLEARLKRGGYGRAFVHLRDKQSIANCITIRKQGQGLLNAIKGEERPVAFVEDTAVSVHKVADYIRNFAKILADNGTSGAFYAHASVGLLHVRPLINLKTREGVARMRDIAEQVSDLVLEYGGSYSGEHGDGLSRSCFNEKMFGPQLYQAFRELKTAFDPRRLMNPGKIVDAPSMTENLRYGPDYQTAEFRTVFDYARDGGSYARAIEACNGMGECRKIGEGTMCPSFQATRDEMHSTRGRANALRLWMSGHLKSGALADRHAYQVLDLCLECKACKAECSSNVDMAKYKYEFLHDYHLRHGTPLRARMFAHINPLSRVGSWFAPVSNWSLILPPAKWVLSRMGITPQRNLPPFVRKTFWSWYESDEQGQSEDGRHSTAAEPARPVVLFVDTFMNYNYPQIGMAATKVLRAGGCKVLAPKRPCCGRPYISKGLLDEARALARQNVRMLAPYARRGNPIVGTEPSCLLTLRDEYLDLLPGDDDAKILAEHAVMMEEYLPSIRERLSFAAMKRKMLIHGHCHQKAALGMGPLLNALKLVNGLDVVESGAGCCGMAGSFGFESEHYDVSMKVGADRLFPKVEAQPADCAIAVSGVSCRQQIEHGTGRKAQHWIEVVADALSEATH